MNAITRLYKLPLQTPNRLLFLSFLPLSPPVFAMAIGNPGSPSTAPDLPVCTVVFGRSTFLGRSLVAALVKSRHWAVRVADTLPPAGPYPIHPEPAAYFQVDVTDRSTFRPAVLGASSVFLVDPLPSSFSLRASRDFPRLHALAVVGAKNLVSACRVSSVRSLVYTGSADVVSNGKNEFDDADETLPYPDKYEDAMNELRMQVEEFVLSANGMDGLSTCVLRPSIVFGPGDSNLVSFVAEQAISGRAKFVVGNGKNVCDLTYVENVVHANICAERTLSSAPASIAGKPFFITNEKPVKLWHFISDILVNLGYSRPSVHIPYKLAMTIVLLLRRARNKPNSCRLLDSVLSPSTVDTLTCSRTFDCSKAKTLFGYSPIVSFQEGVQLTVKSLPQLANDLSHSRERDPTIASKADRMLGSGVVSEILLWRDEKKTFAFVLTSFVLFYWLFLSGRTFVTSSAKILMVVCLSLLIQGTLPSKLFGSNIEKIPSSCFEVSESTVRNIFFALASLWNGGISTVRLLARGDNWSIFFKVAGYLYLIKLLLHIPISVLVGLGLTCLFTVFIVYEQCEDEVHSLKEAAVIGLEIMKEQLIDRLPKFFTKNA
ncbi:3beta-hydroxysteroid-dehydrogenase/decarboxylase [Canna indica]|uniref:3beta-hydroxysteroid-dehydrogenase/decarboxylase n=1 Tax=Canna indica TaxID=4628 RepID=A0AAQ3JW44_9LILI|nr:3beta-hydroxysteroid-dehydrogenase/decarboxylase [Canna indica]